MIIWDSLNEGTLDTLGDAHSNIALGGCDHMAVRPHSLLGNLMPFEARRTLAMKPSANDQISNRQTLVMYKGCFGGGSQGARRPAF